MAESGRKWQLTYRRVLPLRSAATLRSTSPSWPGMKGNIWWQPRQQHQGWGEALRGGDNILFLHRSPPRLPRWGPRLRSLSRRICHRRCAGTWSGYYLTPWGCRERWNAPFRPSGTDTWNFSGGWRRDRDRGSGGHRPLRGINAQTKTARLKNRLCCQIRRWRKEPPRHRERKLL